jgi:hypothetical protein
MWYSIGDRIKQAHFNSAVVSVSLHVAALNII